MFKFKISCPIHNLPYQYLTIAQNKDNFLRCRGCPLDQMSLRISSQVESMKLQMGNQKTKERERTKSKGKKRQIEQDEEEDNQELVLIQRVAEQQVLILQLVMKLLTEDQKKYGEGLQNATEGYRKLWKQYQESTANIMAVNKLYQKNILPQYIQMLSETGWKEMRLMLNSLTNRNFVSKRMIKQSKQIVESFRKQRGVCQESVLRSLEGLVGKISNIERKDDAKDEKSCVRKNKRSKSFAGIS